MYIFISSETGGIDSEKYRLIRNKIDSDILFLTDRNNKEMLLGDNAYGAEFKNIAIIQIILSPDFDICPERKLIKFNKREADIRLKIDYDKYQSADDNGKKLLIVKNLADSIMVIESQKKKDFNGLKLIDDILSALNVTKEELDKL